MIKSILMAALCAALVLNPCLMTVAMAEEPAAQQPLRFPGEPVAQQRQQQAAQPLFLEQVHQRLLTDIEVTQHRIAQLKQGARNRRALNRLQEYRALKQREYQVLKAIDRIEQQMDQQRQQRYRAAQSEVPRRRDRVNIDNTTNLSVILETDDVARAIREGNQKPKFYETWWFWTIIGLVVGGATAGGICGGTDLCDTNYR